MSACPRCVPLPFSSLPPMERSELLNVKKMMINMGSAISGVGGGCSGERGRDGGGVAFLSSVVFSSGSLEPGELASLSVFSVFSFITFNHCYMGETLFVFRMGVKGHRVCRFLWFGPSVHFAIGLPSLSRRRRTKTTTKLLGAWGWRRWGDGILYVHISL